ncbi:MAG: hypothetical protein AMXMBFR84_40340 [Candidatus Hydrogenedentota bacterium]
MIHSYALPIRTRFVHTGLLFGLGLVASAYAQTDPAVMKELEIIADRNEQTYLSLKSFTVKGEYELTEAVDPWALRYPDKYPRRPRVTRCTALWIRDGDRFRTEYTSDRSHPGYAGSTSKKRVSVSNDDYLAAMHMPNHITVFMHDKTQSKSKNGLPAESPDWSQDPRRFGFTAGSSRLLKESLFLHREVLQWSLEKLPDSDGSIFIIEKINPARKGSHVDRCVYELDPDKDYLVTRMRHWNTEGVQDGSIEIELQQLPNGRWFPKRGTRIDEGYSLTMTMLDVTTDMPIDEKLFAVESIEFDPEKATMEVIDAEKRKSAFLRWYRDRWVPVDLILPP